MPPDVIEPTKPPLPVDPITLPVAEALLMLPDVIEPTSPPVPAAPVTLPDAELLKTRF